MAITQYRTLGKHKTAVTNVLLQCLISPYCGNMNISVRVMAKFQLLGMGFCITQGKFFPPTRIPATKEPACRICQALPSDIQFMKIRYCSEGLYSCSIAVPFLPVHALQISQRVVSAVSVRPFAKYSCSITQYMHELKPQSSSIPKTAQGKGTFEACIHLLQPLVHGIS